MRSSSRQEPKSQYSADRRMEPHPLKPISRKPLGAATDNPRDTPQKPRLLFFRGSNIYWSGKFGLPTPATDLPAFLRSHLQQQVKCLSQFFDVQVVTEACDYAQICETYQPDLTLFESGTYGAPRDISNIAEFPEIPKLGFLHADPFCATRGVFLSDMENWGIETYFTMSVSMADYLPDVADKLFVWPNFIDPYVFRDYREGKVIPALITGSNAIHYPWRNRVTKVIAQHFPTMTCPHFGWSGNNTSRVIYDEDYAKMINRAYIVPTCGTFANEIVRKHLEIPGCNSCLVTEETAALREAGFIDMDNCIFASDSNVLDKLDHVFTDRALLERITSAGYHLVHSQHTLRHRNQIHEWLRLYKSLLPGERIVQNGAFRPLTVVGPQSKLTHRHIISNGIDRARLAEGYEALLSGEYDRAERNFRSCLNYWAYMPEPILGLTLCCLYRGKADLALDWIRKSLTWSLEGFRAPHPDPVEWAYLVISLLCQGDVKEAARRAQQFQLLRHCELRRCRTVIDALQGAAGLICEPSNGDARAASRPSVHQLPQRNFSDWIGELCRMLQACQQIELAERVQNIYLSLLNSSPRSARPGVARSRRSSPVLPLGPETFRNKLQRHTPSKVRAMMHPLLAALRSGRKVDDKFAVAIERYAREDSVRRALILGACDQSSYTRAFLEGIQGNPSMPTVLYVLSLGALSGGLERLIPRCLRCNFVSSSIDDAKRESQRKPFDIVLVDNYAFGDGGLSESLVARTVLISDLDASRGHKIVQTVLSDRRCRLIDEGVISDRRYVIFTRVVG